MISSPALSLSFIWFAQHWPKWQRPGVILNKNDETKLFLYFPYCWKRPHYFMDWVKSGSLLCVNFPFTYSNGLCFELSMFPSGRWTALMHLICLLSINLDIFWQNCQLVFSFLSVSKGKFHLLFFRVCLACFPPKGIFFVLVKVLFSNDAYRCSNIVTYSFLDAGLWLLAVIQSSPLSA